MKSIEAHRAEIMSFFGKNIVTVLTSGGARVPFNELAARLQLDL